MSVDVTPLLGYAFMKRALLGSAFYNYGNGVTPPTPIVPPTPVNPNYSLNFVSASPDSIGNFAFANQAGMTYADSAGNLALSTLNTPRREYYGTKPAGIKMEPISTNLCTNYNYNPTVTTGLTSSGTGTAGGVSIVADPSNLLTNAVNEYGYTVNLKTYVCTNNNLIKLDNSTGVSAAYVEFAGPPTALSPVTGSVYVKCPTGSTLSLGATANSVAISSPTVLTRLSLANVTPAETTSVLRLTIPAGAVAYAILNQLEFYTVPTSVIPIAGTNVTRTGDFFNDGSISTRTYINQTQGAIIVDLDVDDNFNQPFIFLSLQNGQTTATYNANNMSMISGSANGRIKPASLATSVRPTLLYGEYAGQGGSGAIPYIHSMDTTNESFPIGFSWNTATNSFVSFAGGLDYQAFSMGTFSATLDKLAIGARFNSTGSLLCGHVRSIKIWNTQPTVQQIGQQIDFTNWKFITNNGQSCLSAAWSSEGTSGVDVGYGFNDGEKALVKQMKQFWPNNRCAIMHMATGGSSISFGNSTGTAVNAWYDYASGAEQPLLGRAMDMAKGAVYGGGEIVGHWINGHESDTTQSYAGLTTSFNYVLNKFWALPTSLTSGKTLIQTPTIFQPNSRRQDGTGNEGGYQHMREFQHAWISMHTNVTAGTERVNLPLTSDQHPTNAGLKGLEPCDVRLMAKIAGFTVANPVNCIDIASATLSGSTITVTLALPAGVTDFSPTSNIQNFVFFDTNVRPGLDAGPTGTRIPFSSVVRTNATTVTLTLASAPTTTGLLYTNYGVMYYNTAAAPSTYTAVDPNQLMKGNDSYGMPLRAKTMLLPYSGT